MSYYPTKRLFAVSRGGGSVVSAALKDKIDLLAFCGRKKTDALVGFTWIQLVVACVNVLESHLSLARVSSYRDPRGACLVVLEFNPLDVGVLERLWFRFVFVILTARTRGVGEGKEHRLVASHPAGLGSRRSSTYNCVVRNPCVPPLVKQTRISRLSQSRLIASWGVNIVCASIAGGSWRAARGRAR